MYITHELIYLFIFLMVLINPCGSVHSLILDHIKRHLPPKPGLEMAGKDNENEPKSIGQILFSFHLCILTSHLISYL